MTTDPPTPPNPDVTQAEALMNIAEAIKPFVEFAEGQKRMLVERGWSPGPAEQFALVVLSGITREALHKLFS